MKLVYFKNTQTIRSSNRNKNKDRFVFQIRYLISIPGSQKLHKKYSVISTSKSKVLQEKYFSFFFNSYKISQNINIVRVMQTTKMLQENNSLLCSLFPCVFPISLAITLSSCKTLAREALKELISRSEETSHFL